MSLRRQTGGLSGIAHKFRAESLCGLGIALVLLAVTAPAAAVTCTHPAGGIEVAVFGDINGNGSVNVADAMCGVLVSLALQGGQPLSSVGCLDMSLIAGGFIADANCDSEIDVSDITVIVGLALGAGVPAALNPDMNGCPAACEDCTGGSGGSCLIEGACVAEGDRTGADGCQVCLPASDPAAYTTESCTEYFFDGDDDGTGINGNTQCACIAADPYDALVGGDCDDSDPSEQTGCTLPTYTTCKEALEDGHTSSGVYSIDPDDAGPGAAFDAYCDLETDGGGWTLLMVSSRNTSNGNGFALSADGLDADFDPPLNPNTTVNGHHDFEKFAAVAGTETILRFTNNQNSANRYELGGDFSDWYTAPTECGSTRVTGGDNNGALVSGSVDGPFTAPARGNGNSHVAVFRGTQCNGGSADSEGLGLGYELRASGPITLGAPFANAISTIGARAQIWFRDGEPDLSIHETCKEALEAGNTDSGVYTIDPDGFGGNAPFDVYCDMVTDDGGWTLLHISARGGNSNGFTYSADGLNADVDPPLSPDAPLNGHHDLSKFQAVAGPDTVIRFTNDHNAVQRYEKGGDFSAWYTAPVECSTTRVTGGDNNGAMVAATPDGPFTTPARGNGSSHVAVFRGTQCNGGSADSEGLGLGYELRANGPVTLGGPAGNVLTTPDIGAQMWLRNDDPPPIVYLSCLDALNAGNTDSGTYFIDPDGTMGNDAFEVYCDMDTDNGGWILMFLAGRDGLSNGFTFSADGLDADFDPPLDPMAPLNGHHDFAKLQALSGPNSIVRFTNNLNAINRYERGGDFSDWYTAPTECFTTRVTGGDNNGAMIAGTLAGPYTTPARGNGSSHAAIFRGTQCNGGSNDSENLGLGYEIRINGPVTLGAPAYSFLNTPGAIAWIWFREN